MARQLSLLAPTHSSKKSKALIYFICGNPGLIEYYADFLSFLRGFLDAADSETAYDIYGRDLLGFSDDDHVPFAKDNLPWDLEGQIEGIYADMATRKPDVNEEESKSYDSVILMGHSVGAYIAVEIFHRHMRDPSTAAELKLRHGFLLFPTITHIKLSPSGRSATRLLKLPTLDAHAHTYAKFFLTLFSLNMLAWVFENVMGFTEHTAEITAKWLKSRDGVWQAIHMGKSELLTIHEDIWPEKLWEVAQADRNRLGEVPKFFMFYGKDDHWVATELRDEFAEKRRQHGKKDGRTRITVDEGHLKHAFCTKEGDSWAVASKVAEWVKEIDSRSKEDN